jgi:plastocyanin
LLSLALALASVSVMAAAAAVQVQVVGRHGQALGDAVVFLEPVAGKMLPVPALGIEIAQEGRQFVPLVTVVPVGTAVRFPNRDRVKHHVYSFSSAKKFEIALYSGKPSNPIEFDQPGLVVLGCNIHDTMVGWVLVSDTPWFGKTPANGQVRWSEVPTGAYRLRTWHPDMPPGAPLEDQALTVGAGPVSATVRVGAGVL